MTGLAVASGLIFGLIKGRRKKSKVRKALEKGTGNDMDSSNDWRVRMTMDKEKIKDIGKKTSKKVEDAGKDLEKAGKDAKAAVTKAGREVKQSARKVKREARK